jgi:hypothetical protein
LNGEMWAVGVSLIVLTIAIHTTGVVMIAFIGARYQIRVGKRHFSPVRAVPLVILHLGVVALILTALHALEAALWGGGYVWLGAIDSFKDALLFSNATMTTLGVAVQLPSRWVGLSTVEAVNATLLFGISTAFIFAILQEYWPLLSRRDPQQ